MSNNKTSDEDTTEEAERSLDVNRRTTSRRTKNHDNRRSSRYNKVRKAAGEDGISAKSLKMMRCGCLNNLT